MNADFSERQIAELLKAAILDENARHETGSPGSPVEDARRAIYLYNSVAPFFELEVVNDEANASSFALGMISELADYHALSTREWKPGEMHPSVFPTVSSIGAAIRRLRIDKWADAQGVELPLAPDRNEIRELGDIAPGMTGSIQDGSSEISKELVETLSRAAITYQQSRVVSDQGRGAALQSERMRTASCEQIAEARSLALRATASLGPQVQMIAAAIMHISRGFFILAWSGETKYPSVALLRNLVTSADSSDWLHGRTTALPDWLVE